MKPAISMTGRRQVMLAAAGWVAALKTYAQTKSRVRVVGVLVRDTVADGDVQWFSGELSKLGWPLGSVTFEFRGAGEPLARFPELARELVGRGVDLIMVPGGTSAVLAAKDATNTIPILAIGMGDPIRYGLAKSLDQPSRNVTGIADSDLEQGKWLELSHELLPSATRIAVVADSSNVSYSGYSRGFENAARRLGLKLQMVPVANRDGIVPAFEAMKHQRAEVVILASSVAWGERDILEWAASSNLPVVAANSLAAEHGAVISYTFDVRAVFQRAAVFVDKLLRGVKPGDLPFETPTRYELIINKKSDKNLALPVPQSLLLRADKLIE